MLGANYKVALPVHWQPQATSACFCAREKNNESDYHLPYNYYFHISAHPFGSAVKCRTKKPDGIMTGQTQKG
jgi:hypothetical protein